MLTKLRDDIDVPLAIILSRSHFNGPRCYIKEFYVPALDLSLNPNISDNYNNNNKNTIIINPCLFFDLAFHNILESDLLYGDVNLTFSYGQSAVANYIVPSFYQTAGKTYYRREVVESRGVPWETALQAVLNRSTVVFRVDLVAWPSYYNGEFRGDSEKKNLTIGAYVQIDGSGMKVEKEDIRLDSAASQRGLGIMFLFPSLLVSSLHCLFV
ncbi:PREDICTED: protein NDR1-like [Erythranthe guttata]|uniref:protein NDR1-like n=1 Tax=Erythranthe guttata TaxID=4155 RepID=UPI00064D83D7|nr:PREDICTED: protein NDR1-like [Erythranthe guttata]|eukprot:XP_012852384.1 PREDICTED: protein NDR1-like [Erythranthe guttata]